MKKLFYPNLLKWIVTLFFVGGFMISTAAAQFGIGASYEVRSKDPQNGFGLRIENMAKLPIPLLSLGFRAHFSYFSAQNKITSSGNVSYETNDLKDYDIGLDAIGEVKLGLVNPYIGLGLGSRTYKVDYKAVTNLSNEQKSSIFYNGTIGVQLGIIPVLKPFIEYRVSKSNLKDFKGAKPSNTNGRYIFGVLLQF